MERKLVMVLVKHWAAVVAFSIPVLSFSFTLAAAEEGEKKVSIDQVPTAVKMAIRRAVGDGKLVDIGEFDRGGEKSYEIEMVVDGKEYDVLFSSTGKVLKKTFEGLKGKEGKGKEGKGKEGKGKEGKGKEGKGKEGKGEEGKGEEGNEEEEEKEDRGEKETGTTAGAFQDSFDIESRDLASTGRNRYFILEPGYQLVLEGKEAKHDVQLAITVLDETRRIGNVETRVMEERESADGELIEISRNFFAICKSTKSVFYFGEEVDIYKDGKVVAHEGAWLHGKNRASAGMMMPGEAMLGARYHQEVAPGVAMDRATIVDLNTTLKTPAGEFKGCLKVQEENPLDREKEFKIHAPGVGLIQDEDLLLVKCGFINRSPSGAEVQERKTSLQPSELPPLFRKAIQKAFPAGKVLGIQKEVEGENPGQYDVDILSGGKIYEVEISPEGKVIEIKEKGSAEETSAGSRA